MATTTKTPRKRQNRRDAQVIDLDPNPIVCRIAGPVQLRIGRGKGAALHTFTPFNCTCEDQTYRDVVGEVHTCQHIDHVMQKLTHLIARGQRTFRIPSRSRNGLIHTVTIASCDCGGTVFDRYTGELCEAGIIFYERMSGWRDPYTDEVDDSSLPTPA